MKGKYLIIRIIIGLIAFILGITLSFIIGNCLNKRNINNTLNLLQYMRNEIVKYKIENDEYPKNLKFLNEKTIDSWNNPIEMIIKSEVIILCSGGRNKQKDFGKNFSDDIFIVIFKDKIVTENSH